MSEKPELKIEETDVGFEEELLRNPHSVKMWLRYIDHKTDWLTDEEITPIAKQKYISDQNIIYERAILQLPGSYKIWYNYLTNRRQQIRHLVITESAYESVNNAFERALVFLHKMPRIWIDYCKFLVYQCKITKARLAFDRALQALPLTQHYRVWPLYIDFIRQYDLPETTIRIYRRYLKLMPEHTEDYIEYLISIDRLDEAACRLVKIINDDKFVSKHGKSKYQLWHELCELISKNPEEITSLKVDPIIRGGIANFTDNRGQLWNALADYHIRAGHFETVRDVFEEGMHTVTTVRDFVQIFDAYSNFEEGVVQQRMEEMESGEPSDLFATQFEFEVDLELRMARYEHLMDRRPLLMNSVLLRQNPHNVNEWHKRVELFNGKNKEIIETYSNAVQTVNIELAVGKPHSLWCEFAKFYENNSQLEEARIILTKATLVNYKRVEDLSSVWCEWAEMELRHNNYRSAINVLKQATSLPSIKAAYHDASEPVQNRVYKSLKVWSMYADLEECFGTFQTTKAVYERILDLKIATPQIVINYCILLEENNYFEEAFSAYEKGIALFSWPNVNDLWNTYLSKFTARNLQLGGKYIERARELFEQAIDKCPAEHVKPFYLMYADLEEKYGLAKNAMTVYDRATEAVKMEDKLEMYTLFVKRAQEIFGVTHTRQIYEKAIEQLSNEDVRIISLRYAELERALGEIDRARGIYAHASQVCDPRTCDEFWQTWHEFEVSHGNEDTFREMLRIKRSVQATFNTQINFPAQLNSALVNPVKFVKATTDTTDATDSNTQIQVTNPDEIDLQDDNDDDDDDDADVTEQLVEIPVPDTVYGHSLAKTALELKNREKDDDNNNNNNNKDEIVLGAKARLASQKQ